MSEIRGVSPGLLPCYPFQHSLEARPTTTCAARDDYYLKGGEPPGYWLGDGAKLLGLAGRVEEKPCKNLLAGLWPDGRDELVQGGGGLRHQPGWDLSFSCPKSVTVIWCQGEPGVRKAIQERRPTRSARPWTTSRTRRPAPAGASTERSGNRPSWSSRRLSTARAAPGSPATHALPRHERRGAGGRDHRHDCQPAALRPQNGGRGGLPRLNWPTNSKSGWACP